MQMIEHLSCTSFSDTFFSGEVTSEYHPGGVKRQPTMPGSKGGEMERQREKGRERGKGKGGRGTPSVWK